MKSKILYEIEVYDIKSILEKIREHNIEIFDVSFNNHFLKFKSSPFYKKRIIKLFPSIKITHEYGFLIILRNLLIKKTTVLSLILSCVSFYYLNSKVYDVKVDGDSRFIEGLLIEKLEEYGIKKNIKKPDINTLLQWEQNIKKDLYKEIEFLEIRLNGLILNIKFNKRRISATTPILKNDMYASKCGVIKSINISSGDVLVEPNEYVEEGQILVKSTITNSKGEEVYIGTQGRIYAYTWNIVEVEDNNYVNEVESYVALLEKARRIVSHDFEKEEKIDKEVILKYEVTENEMFLRIHYTCIENIAYCI